MIVAIAAVLTILGNFVDIAPLLASVGVVGLALGLGAQALVKDFIGGAFILIENQFSVLLKIPLPLGSGPHNRRARSFDRRLQSTQRECSMPPPLVA